MFRLGGSVNGRGATPNISHLFNSEVTSKTNSLLGRDMLVLMRVATSKKQLQWTITILKRRYIFKMIVFHCHVSAQEGSHPRKDTFELIFVVWPSRRGICNKKRRVVFSLVFAKFVPTTCFRMFVLRQNILQTRLFSFCRFCCWWWSWPTWLKKFFFSATPNVQEELLITCLTFLCLKGDRSSCLCFVVVYPLGSNHLVRWWFRCIVTSSERYLGSSTILRRWLDP